MRAALTPDTDTAATSENQHQKLTPVDSPARFTTDKDDVATGEKQRQQPRFQITRVNAIRTDKEIFTNVEIFNGSNKINRRREVKENENIENNVEKDITLANRHPEVGTNKVYLKNDTDTKDNNIHAASSLLADVTETRDDYQESENSGNYTGISRWYRVLLKDVWDHIFAIFSNIYDDSSNDATSTVAEDALHEDLDSNTVTNNNYGTNNKHVDAFSEEQISDSPDKETVDKEGEQDYLRPEVKDYHVSSATADLKNVKRVTGSNIRLPLAQKDGKTARPKRAAKTGRKKNTAASITGIETRVETSANDDDETRDQERNQRHLLTVSPVPLIAVLELHC